MITHSYPSCSVGINAFLGQQQLNDVLPRVHSSDMESIVIILRKPIKYLIFQKVLIPQRVLHLLNYKNWHNFIFFLEKQYNIFNSSCIINCLTLPIFFFNVYKKAILKKYDIIKLNYFVDFYDENRTNFALPHLRVRPRTLTIDFRSRVSCISMLFENYIRIVGVVGSKSIVVST